MNNSSCLSVDCSTVSELLMYVHCTLGNDPSCSDLVMGWASGNVIAKNDIVFAQNLPKLHAEFANHMCRIF